MGPPTASGSTRKVLASFETPDGSHCLDVFVRDDGSFGFEEFRAESDGAARWQSLGRHGSLVFTTGAEALSAAQTRVPWLDQTESWRW